MSLRDNEQVSACGLVNRIHVTADLPDLPFAVMVRIHVLTDALALIHRSLFEFTDLPR